MLDVLLACGNQPPLLSLILSWVSPTLWVRLRLLRRSFREALGPRELSVIVETLAVADPAGSSCAYASSASEQRKKTAALHDLLDAAAASSNTCCDSSEGGSGGASAALSLLFGLLAGAGAPGAGAGAGAAEHAPGDCSENALCERVFLALLRGANVNAMQPCTGLTPLMRAGERGLLRLCHLLVSHGADADLESIGGSTALALALGAPCERSDPRCPRPSVVQLLLGHTRSGLPEAFATCVRRALQDEAYLPVLNAFAAEDRLSVDAEIQGPDSRLGTALSASLERRVHPVEGPILHRPSVVASLLALRADTRRPGPYVAWWGGPAALDLRRFAATNGVDATTLQLLSIEDASEPRNRSRSHDGTGTGDPKRRSRSPPCAVKDAMVARSCPGAQHFGRSSRS